MINRIFISCLMLCLMPSIRWGVLAIDGFEMIFYFFSWFSNDFSDNFFTNIFNCIFFFIVCVIYTTYQVWYRILLILVDFMSNFIWILLYGIFCDKSRVIYVQLFESFGELTDGCFWFISYLSPDLFDKNMKRLHVLW